MAAQNRVYTVSMTRITIPTAVTTLIQILAGATVPLQLIRALVAQSSSTSSTQLPIEICRKSAAATVTSYTPRKNGPSTDPAASAVGGVSATGTNASAEGTNSDILIQDVWNYLNGWLWIPTSPKEYKFVDAATILAMRFPVAPGGTLVTT